MKLDTGKIKDMIYKKGGSIAEFTRRCGITADTFYAAQAGRREPSMRTIYRIANALGVDPQDIIKKD
jgi:transcriptional regulator with XRE-family HTH domain